MNQLTNKQLTELKTLKSIDELKSFLNKENITLTDEEMVKASKYFESDKSELTDDELDIVAGGDDKGDEYKAKAFADGRTVAVYNYATKDYLPAFSLEGFCSCYIEQAWAREVTSVYFSGAKNLKASRTYTFYDCKCYRCGHSEAMYVSKEIYQ